MSQPSPLADKASDGAASSSADAMIAPAATPAERPARMLRCLGTGGGGRRYREQVLGGTPEQRIARHPGQSPPEKPKRNPNERAAQFVSHVRLSAARRGRIVEFDPDEEESDEDPDGVCSGYRLESQTLLNEWIEGHVMCVKCARINQQNMLDDFFIQRIGQRDAKMTRSAFEAKHSQSDCSVQTVSEHREGLASRYEMACERGHTSYRWTSPAVRSAEPSAAAAGPESSPTEKTRLSSSATKHSGRQRREVNVRTAAGAMATGMGGYQVERFCAFLDVPAPPGLATHTIPGNASYAGKVYEAFAAELLAYWNEEEKRLVVLEWVEGGSNPEDDPNITVKVPDGKGGVREIDCVLVGWSVDGAWVKRSSGSDYSSHSGVQWAFGRLSSRLLDFNVYNLECAKCVHALRVHAKSEEHAIPLEPTPAKPLHKGRCCANFTKDGSTTSVGGVAYRAGQAGTMEPAGVAKMVKRAPLLHSTVVKWICMDDDATTKAWLRHMGKGGVAECLASMIIFYADPNHRIKNMVKWWYLLVKRLKGGAKLNRNMVTKMKMAVSAMVHDIGPSATPEELAEGLVQVVCHYAEQHEPQVFTVEVESAVKGAGAKKSKKGKAAKKSKKGKAAKSEPVAVAVGLELVGREVNFVHREGKIIKALAVVAENDDEEEDDDAIVWQYTVEFAADAENEEEHKVCEYDQSAARYSQPYIYAYMTLTLTLTPRVLTHAPSTPQIDKALIVEGITNVAVTTFKTKGCDPKTCAYLIANAKGGEALQKYIRKRRATRQSWGDQSLNDETRNQLLQEWLQTSRPYLSNKFMVQLCHDMHTNLCEGANAKNARLNHKCDDRSRTFAYQQRTSMTVVEVNTHYPAEEANLVHVDAMEILTGERGVHSERVFRQMSKRRADEALQRADEEFKKRRRGKKKDKKREASGYLGDGKATFHDKVTNTFKEACPKCLKVYDVTKSRVRLNTHVTGVTKSGTTSKAGPCKGTAEEAGSSAAAQPMTPTRNGLTIVL